MRDQFWRQSLADVQIWHESAILALLDAHVMIPGARSYTYRTTTYRTTTCMSTRLRRRTKPAQTTLRADWELYGRNRPDNRDQFEKSLSWQFAVYFGRPCPLQGLS